MLKIIKILLRFGRWLHCTVYALQVCLWTTRPAWDRQHLLYQLCWNCMWLMMFFLLCASISFSTASFAGSITDCQWVLFEPSCFHACYATYLHFTFKNTMDIAIFLHLPWPWALHEMTIISWRHGLAFFKILPAHLNWEALIRVSSLATLAHIK